MLTRTIAVLASTALASAALADPLHEHCERRPWGPITLTPTPSAAYPIPFPTPSGAAINFALDNFRIPEPLPAPSMMPNCQYETSDITYISVTMVLSAGSAVTFGSVIGASATTLNIAPSNAAPYRFTPATPTIVFTFSPHELSESGVLHVAFPNPAVSLSFGNGTSPAGQTGTIEGITIELRGNHYFVPAPGAAALLFMGAAVAARRRRRCGRS